MKAAVEPTKDPEMDAASKVLTSINEPAPNTLKPTEQREGNCYCGKERNLNIVELLCASCSRWFHESCIGYQLGKLVPFMMNYVFFCKNCSQTGLESFKKNQAPFPHMCITAIANLMQASIKEGMPRTMFSKDLDIIPFMESHWEGMTTMSRRVTQSWHATIQRTLAKDIGVIFTNEESPSPGGNPATLGHPLFGLLLQDLTTIKPNYDAMVKSGALKITNTGVQKGGNLKGRGTKRKLDTAGPGKRKGGDGSTTKLPSHGYPLDHPWNKDGYRYILAEPDPHAPFRQEFDESSDWAGKPIPGWLYRTLSPSTVLLALHDRAPVLRISEDRLSVTGDKGYCMVRATHSVSRGTWYFEVKVTEMPEGSACRVGWGQEYANLQAPLGYDKFGYSWRSRKGTSFHESRGLHYGEPFGLGDVLGCLIIMPETDEGEHLPKTYKDRPLVKFKSHLYYEDKDKVPEAIKALKPLSGSKLVFFKNGVCQGVAYKDVYKGAYYPCISLFRNIIVQANFGPDFAFTPKDFKDGTKELKFRPMSDKAEESIIEQTTADLLYLTENQGKLRLDTYYM
ncbi:set1/Ash2 histone methyltransferase complex subunit ASH2 [Cloeon dipterum]|uniref:set1/Ash2 histone methyltransferase complex subunit ASH2 n=1 Tax=Cloeon dipterum TaxID=197152 RepID=UPI00322083C1